MHNFYGKLVYKVECNVATQYGYLCLFAPPSDSLLNTEKKMPHNKFLTDMYLCVRFNYESRLQCDSIMVDVCNNHASVEILASVVIVSMLMKELCDRVCIFLSTGFVSVKLLFSLIALV